MRTFIHHGWDVTLGCNFPNGSHFALGGGGKKINGGWQQPCYISLFLLLGHFALCPKMKQSTFDCKFSWDGVKNTLSGQPGLEPSCWYHLSLCTQKHSLVPSTSPFLGLTTTYNFLGSEALKWEKHSNNNPQAFKYVTSFFFFFAPQFSYFLKNGKFFLLKKIYTGNFS
jgi:hypothetical protein